MIASFSVLIRVDTSPLVSCALGEVALSQHQQSFLADNSDDIARVARRVLSVLASGSVEQPKHSDGPRSSSDTVGLEARLYFASFSREPSEFAETLDAARQCDGSTRNLAFELIPRVARRLGAAWVDDAISFSDVTVGCARLQSALRSLPDGPQSSPCAVSDVIRDCLVLVPQGAQHTLGALVLVKHLRQARQRVVAELEANEARLQRLADQNRFDVILISASCSECPNGLRAMVLMCRHHWPASKIVVGGSITQANKDVVRGIGADCVTSVWQEALEICN